MIELDMWPNSDKDDILILHGRYKNFSRSSCSLVLTPVEVIISVRMLSLSRLTES